MANATWACFECRETVRGSDFTRATVLCPCCGQPCRHVGHKLRMPAKRDAKAWKDLLNALQQGIIEKAERDQLLRLQRIRELHTEIDRLEAMGPNEGRAKQVRLLRRQLEKL